MSWEPLLQLRRGILRDLGAVICCPALLEHGSCLPLAQSLPTPDGSALDVGAALCWLHELEEGTQNCDAALAELEAPRAGERLGVYAQRLFRFWLANYGPLRGWRTVHGLQACERSSAGVLTVGEFDVLLHAPGAALHHLELSVKFLCFDPSRDCWLGPHRSETLAARVDRLHRQLALPLTPVGGAAVRDWVGAQDSVAVVSSAVLYGWLFHPRSSPAASASAPGPRVSDTHWRGWWSDSVEAILADAPASRRWLILPKRRWLSPAVAPADDPALLDAEGLRAVAAAALQSRAIALAALAALVPATRREGRVAEAQVRACRLMVAEMEEEAGRWVETGRGFLVEPGWGDTDAG